MADMTVTVTMTPEDFQEFMAWKKDRELYDAEVSKIKKKWLLLANKATWALEEDPKCPGKIKITDQEHAAELLEMAKGYLA